ncbi:hypothetical protein PHYPSEUDO_011527 [Phytophthora pseudosyringae]|uniref:Uncharacterized protein n=1 Tax=Phytophthora pseudosyringae TaxID=221518 RepID=A0A8T1V969_9STRA|nr:hypothetical protein PHYPSEUDO_011527 [Phytophthora pseudosyringae]
MEISISETLGDITVREDYGSVHDGAYISNHRLMSNHDSVTSEVNTATFDQYFEGANEFERSSCAILATDNVDEDALHPYNSREFVRRDVTAAIVLTQERRTKQTSTSSPASETGACRDWSQRDSEEEIVVVMRRAAFMKIYSPSFEVPENSLLEMNERISKVMTQTIREIIDAQS